ncbi:MAG TPA: hypothetical protein VFL66_03880 [Gaiellaceae bacterium]|nr:hypothetical protein [Gaiellaceae bacterium]
MALRFEVYDGLELEGTVFRIVSACPPTIDDFRSYADLGRAFPSYHMFRATGVSMYLTQSSAEDANARFNLGDCIAELELRDNRNLWALTGGRDHITVWATPTVLLNRVVRCAEDRRGR